MKYFSFALIFLMPALLLAQSKQEIEIDLEWQKLNSGKLWFDGAITNERNPGLPIYSLQVPVTGPGLVSSSIEIVAEESVESDINVTTSAYSISSWVEEDRGEFTAFVSLIPIRNDGQKYILTQGRIHIDFNPISKSPIPGNKDNSVLSQGSLLKIEIQEDGLYAINGSDLASALGIAVGSIDPQLIELYGNPGGPLPLPNIQERNDDLEPLSFTWVGLDDNTLNGSDKLVFYAEGPNTWAYEEDEWVYHVNPYASSNYVFIRYGIASQESPEAVDGMGSSGMIRSSYTDHQYYGKELLNLLGRSPSHQGSGTLWLSDEISNTRKLDVSGEFDFTNLISTTPIKVKAHLYGRAESSSTFRMNIDGETFTKTVGRINYDVESLYARLASFKEEVVVSADPQVLLEYPATGFASEGWVDFVTIEMRKSAVYQGPMVLTDTFGTSLGGFEVQGAPADALVWDVTDINDIKQVSFSRSGQTISFSVQDPHLRRFLIFSPTEVTTEPVSINTIPNQNLHSIQDADMITVYHPLFKSEVDRHAAHRAQHDGLNVITVNVQDIYNEFASGREEPAAIRDFARMLHQRSSNFKYLLLFGDGSYDYKYVVASNEDQNFIPVFETEESLDPIFAFPTDDFYALLSDDEGGRLRGSLDIAVGRYLCRNEAEAKLLVDKLITYETDPESLGDWRNRLIFLADDEDGNQHLNDVERIAVSMENEYPVFNQDKIYFDAYPQVSTPGGTRFPEVTRAISSSIFKGALVMVYLGHGGPTGLAQERVLQSSDILKWENMYNLPIIMTATCSFTAYDEPGITSAGEHSVLSPSGGTVAILSTVRAVYAGENYLLTKAVHDFIYERDNGVPQRIGEIMRLAKNSARAGGDDSNNRKFSLFGDPSMKIALPEFEVSTTKINGVPVQDFADTLGALDFVEIEGEILDHNSGLMNDFNGTIFVTLFDKAITLTTMGTDSRSFPRDFDLQKNILFRGSATVENGEWTIQFALPRDLNFSFGEGKLSYYAHDETRDASGSYEQIVIGGTGNGLVNDDEGPLVEVFMNDENFRFGGITSPNPLLFVKLSDDYGINVVGNSIGHDLTAVLDGDTRNTFILNDFYEATKDNYREGVVRYPLQSIPEGRHRIDVTAWDIANNFSEGFTEFVVVEDVTTSIQKVLSYPNPFSEYTIFGFEHNLPPGRATLEVQIVSAAGREVKRIKQDFNISGFRVTDLTWDGTDNSGSRVPNGVYLYKIMMKRSVQGSEIVKESAFERVVVLK
jgi:hypothetical protein